MKAILFWVSLVVCSAALADTVVQMPDGRIVRCSVTNIGTVVCL